MIKYETSEGQQQKNIRVAVSFKSPEDALVQISEMNIYVIDRMITTFLEEAMETPEMKPFMDDFKKRLCDNIMNSDTIANHYKLKELQTEIKPEAKTE